jgi:hypothetical protein
LLLDSVDKLTRPVESVPEPFVCTTPALFRALKVVLPALTVKPLPIVAKPEVFIVVIPLRAPLFIFKPLMVPLVAAEIPPSTVNPAVADTLELDIESDVPLTRL